MPTPRFTVDYHEFRIMEKVTTALRNRIRNGLYISAGIVQDEAKKVAPRHVGNHIQHTGVVQTDVNTYKVRIYVKIADAPDAAAWEFGSGLHRTRGKAPGKYGIDAVNAPNLVFWWERMGVVFVGPHVNHPGIVAKPYLHPALFNNLARIKRELMTK